ncbi:hypothetical protein PXQ59_002151 [Vibrio parahaemolyticus]|nr:hypothetical protein [Vibrio parahaemolyticus]
MREGKREGKGYNGFSESVNATEAKEEGRFPAKRASEILKIDIDTLRYFFETDDMEWHHVGKDRKKVKFYDVDEIREKITQEVLDFDKETKKRKAANKPKILKGCEVTWVDWNKKPAVERTEKNCTIKVSGGGATKYTITTKDGHSFSKMKGATGFSFKTKEQLKKESDQDNEFMKWRKDQSVKLNKNLKEMLADKSKQLFVVDYDNYIREHGQIKLHDLSKEDDVPERITKKLFKEMLKDSGLDYASRTVDECLEKGYSRLHKSKLVIFSDNPTSLLKNLRDLRIDYLLEQERHIGMESLEYLVDVNDLHHALKDRTDEIAMDFKERFQEKNIESFLNNNRKEDLEDSVLEQKQKQNRRMRIK